MTDTTLPDQHFLTLQEVAKRLRVSERTVHNFLNSGELSGSLIARRWKFTIEAVEDFERSKIPAQGKGAKRKRAYNKKKAVEAI